MHEKHKIHSGWEKFIERRNMRPFAREQTPEGITCCEKAQQMQSKSQNMC